MKGLRVSVLRSGSYDCTNGGVSAKTRDLTLVGPGIPEIFEATADAPAIEIDTFPAEGLRAGYLCVYRGEIGGSEMSRLMGTRKNAPKIVRALAKPAGRESGMFGGNFIHTSDSRFPFEGPVPIFDRYEV